MSQDPPSNEPYREGHALRPSDFPNNQSHAIFENLSRSQFSLREVVELAKVHDPEAYRRAVEEVQHSTIEKGCKWSVMPVDEIGLEFGCLDVSQGLTTEQVLVNRETYGPNVLTQEKSDPWWKIFLLQFKSPVVILLLVAAVVALSFGEWAEGIVIFLIVILNATLATYMEKSAGDALARLASLAAPKCRVLRDGGQEFEIDSINLVPGDVVKLSTGDNIPGDLRVIEVMELKTNEAILTGEAEDAKKTERAKDPTSPFASNLCFASTSVTDGSGTCITYATGMETQVGKIAEQLARESAKGSSLTPMQKGLNRLGGLIGIIAICVLAVIVVVAIVTEYEDPSHPDTNRVLSVVLLAVGFAVSSIPEGLPMVVTICLSLGCKDMVERNANVRKLPAVEILGSCTTVCSDKTGTLTEGKMTAARLETFCRGLGPALDFGFYPTKGFAPYGGVFAWEDLTEGAKNSLNDEYANGTHKYDQTITNYGGHGDDAKSKMVSTICAAGCLNSYGTKIEKEDEQWKTSGNMSEGAVVVGATKGGWGTLKHTKDPHPLYPRDPQVEVPFNSRRKMMATVHTLPTPGTFIQVYVPDLESGPVTHVAILKGAPDRVVDACEWLCTTADGSIKVDWSSKMNEEEKTGCLARNNELSSNALRVLAFSVIPLSKEDLRTLSAQEDADSRLTFLLKQKVVLLGFMGSVDPPRYGVEDAIASCREASVRVIMITGDHKITAEAIAKDIGILQSESGGGAIMCADLHENGDPLAPHLPQEEIDAITKRVNVYSRAQPEDKIVIVNSLKDQGDVTAMTGDGVNDAPALKAAHIGIAMGINGTDVAKGASDMVLLDDNFVTIVAAIEQGRKIYANIQKFVAFLLGTNVGEIIYLTVAICAGMKMPVEALQILFLNLASDGCPAVALAREPPDEDIMKKPPRDKDSAIVTKDWWIYGILPHTIFEAICVILSLVVAMKLATGEILLEAIGDQCGTSNDIRYYCRTYEYRRSVGWVTNIDYLSGGELHQALGVTIGMNKEFSPNHADWNLPPPECDVVEGADGDGWCLPTEENPYGYQYVTTRASKIATTQSFITAVFCEMLRAYTVRSWAWFYQVFNRNPWMHIACAASATMTLLLTIIPGINDIFGLMPIEWWQYLLASSWGLVNLVLDEIIPKPIYRRVLKNREETEKQDLEVFA